MLIRIPVVPVGAGRVSSAAIISELDTILTELRHHRYQDLWFRTTLIRHSRNGTTVRISVEIRPGGGGDLRGAAQTRRGAFTHHPCTHVLTDLSHGLSETWPGWQYVGQGPKRRASCECVCWRPRHWSRKLVAPPPVAERRPVAPGSGEGAIYSLAYLAHKQGITLGEMPYGQMPLHEIRAYARLKGSAGA